MANKKKTNNNFKRNLFFFFLFIVLAGITFYPLDQKQIYKPNAQNDPIPTFTSIGDCATNNNCPTPLPTDVLDQLPTGVDQLPTGVELAVTDPSPTPTTDQTTIENTTGQSPIDEIITLIRQLIDLLLGNGGCPTSANDIQSSSYYDDTDSGLASDISAFTSGKKKWSHHRRGHRHWKKWHRKHHKGLLKRVKCKEKQDSSQPGGQTPTPSNAPAPSDIPEPTMSAEPTISAEPSPSAGAGTMTCGNPGDPGNELGVGKTCTKGGGECQGSQSPYCALDFKTGVPGICSKPCASDMDCGTNARCSGSGLEKGCEPTSCGTTTQ